MHGTPQVQRLHGIEARDVSAAADADGRLTICACTWKDELFLLYQLSPGGPFADQWIPLGLPVGAAGAPVIALAADDRMQLFVRGRDGAVWHAAKTLPNHLSFSPWTQIGGWSNQLVQGPAVLHHLPDDPVVCAGQGGLLHLFVPGADSAIWCATEVNRDRGVWSKFHRVTHAVSSRPAAVRCKNGLVNLFVRGSNQAVWQYSQEPNGSWSCTSLGGVVEGAPVAAYVGDRFEVFARAANQGIWHIWETRPELFGPWQPLGFHPSLALAPDGTGVFPAEPRVITNADGRMELLVVGDRTPWLWHASEVRPRMGWTSWAPLVAAAAPDRAQLVRHADGRLAVIYVDGEGVVSAADQELPGAWHMAARPPLAAARASR